MDKKRVVLFGASGTMGFEAFKELWKRKDEYDITLLLLPLKKEKKMFRRYEEECHIPSIPHTGVVENEGFKIVWGDVTVYDDVLEAIDGADWVLDAMAFISPMADYYPKQARAVNTEGIKNIVRAIEAQPDGAKDIRLIYTGTVAETGDRLGKIHRGRTGDPLKPSIFDYYAITKIDGERCVLESDIEHWASLRMTYILPTEYKALMSLLDPIMFHQPIDTFMENVTDRDAGFGLINCLDVDDESDFWRRVYNMGGGPKMRCTAYEFMNRAYRMNGLSGIEKCAQRRWFALRNFHMQYYDDSHKLDEYLHYWRDTMDSWEGSVRSSMSLGMRLVVFMCEKSSMVRRVVEKITYTMLRDLARDHRNGTVYWYNHDNELRISAFYKDRGSYEAIPEWGVDMPKMSPEPRCKKLDHGYDESKKRLELVDLKKAAGFRGGECLTDLWEGDMFEVLEWRCAFGHTFTAKPNTVLKTGHWCPTCMHPPWKYDAEAKKNPFFAQVWYPNHRRDEHNVYPEEAMGDIAGADKG